MLPHMGWNTVTPPAESTLFAGVAEERFYFVHSYAACTRRAGGETMAVHGAAVRRGDRARVRCRATQFHPEKSGDAGLALLQNWVRSL